MSARAMPTGSTIRPAERVPSVGSVRSGKPAAGEIRKPARLRTFKPRPTNGERAFDGEAFLAKAGLGRKILQLKKDQVVYVQGDAADAIFYVQSGRLKITVASSNGKEATIGLVGASEFYGGKLPGLFSSSSTGDGYRDDRVCAAQD